MVCRKLDKLKYMIPKKTCKNKIRQKKNKQTKKNKKTTTTATTKKQHNNHIAKPPNSKISIYGKPHDPPSGVLMATRKLTSHR